MRENFKFIRPFILTHITLITETLNSLDIISSTIFFVYILNVFHFLPVQFHTFSSPTSTHWIKRIYQLFFLRFITIKQLCMGLICQLYYVGCWISCRKFAKNWDWKQKHHRQCYEVFQNWFFFLGILNLHA